MIRGKKKPLLNYNIVPKDNLPPKSGDVYELGYATFNGENLTWTVFASFMLNDIDKLNPDENKLFGN